MFYHQKVARVRVFADIQNFALRAQCVHGIPIQALFFSLKADSNRLGAGGRVCGSEGHRKQQR